MIEASEVFLNSVCFTTCPIPLALQFSTVGVKYRGYHRLPVTAQNSEFDGFPPVANSWGTIHAIPDKAPPLQAEEEDPPA
jgi:hypothetical protein